MNIGPLSTNDLQEQVDSATGGSPYRTPAVMPPSEKDRVFEEMMRDAQELRIQNKQLEKELSFANWRQLALAYLVVLFFSAAAISLFCHLINHHESLFR